MATPSLFPKKSNLEEANEAFGEIGVQFGTVNNLIGSIKEANRTIRDLTTKTKSDLNRHELIKNRALLILVPAIFEALLSVRVFGFLLHGALNIPMTKWMWVVDFAVGLFFSYLLIKATIWALYTEKQVMSVKEPFMGYFFLLLVPIINMCIYNQTDDKQGEQTFLVLSFLTLIFNAIAIRLVVKSMTDERYDMITKNDGEELENARKSLVSLYKKFDGCRHRIEGISPKFVTPYVQLSASEKALVNYPVYYLYILQERIFAGRTKDLVDTGTVKRADYPFIEEFEKVEARQPIY